MICSVDLKVWRFFFFLIEGVEILRAAQWEKTGSRKETKLTEAWASRHQQPPADVLTISPMAPLGPAPNNWVNNLHRLLNAHVLLSWPATLITDKAKSTHECGQLDRAVRTHQFKTVSNFCRGKPEARRKRKRLLNSSFKPGPRVPSSPLHRGQCRPPSNRPWGVRGERYLPEARDPPSVESGELSCCRSPPAADRAALMPSDAGSASPARPSR